MILTCCSYHMAWRPATERFEIRSSNQEAHNISTSPVAPVYATSMQGQLAQAFRSDMLLLLYEVEAAHSY